MTEEDAPRSSRSLLPMVVIAVLLGGAGVAALLLLGLDTIVGPVSNAWEALRNAPAPIYFAVVSVALLAPLPASVFYVSAGPLYGVPTSLAYLAPTLAINALLVHAIGSTALRPALIAWIGRRGFDLPSLESRSDQLLFTTLVRVTPGIPYFIQSWAIALGGVERLPFVLISVGIQMLYATGFVVLGQSAFEGRLGSVALAIGFLVAVGIAARILHGRLGGRSGESNTGASSND